MKLPSVPFGFTTVAGLGQWLRQLSASIAAGWTVEHTPTGTHDWHWTKPAFDANRFTGDGTITWTVASNDRIDERFGRLGSLACWSCLVSSTTTGGSASNQLRVTIPDGYSISGYHVAAAAYAVDNGTVAPARVVMNDGTNYAQVRKNDGTNWSAASTDATTVYFTVVFAVTT